MKGKWTGPIIIVIGVTIFLIGTVLRMHGY